MRVEDSRKSALCRLAIAGCPDDGMIPVYTGCVDGNGRPCIVVINENKVERIVDNRD